MKTVEEIREYLEVIINCTYIDTTQYAEGQKDALKWVLEDSEDENS